MKTIRLAVAAVLLACSIPLASASAAEPSNVSRSGLPLRPDSDAAGPADIVGPIRARRPGGKLLNLDRMLLNSPAFAQAWNTMFGTIRQKLAVPAKLRETAIMSIGVLNKADYEWFQHEGEYLKAGGTREQLATLKNASAALKDGKHFHEAELATLALTYEMTRNIQVKPATMKRIRAVLPDEQVVELIGTIAGYNMVSRFVVATGLDPEAS
jgi:alkylhydroperoxidase family enzyme